MSEQPHQKPEPYGYSGAGLEAYKSQRSPQVILELILRGFSIQSCLDVGCGIGIWSKYLEQMGKEVVGIDGSWVPRHNLMMSESNFRVLNITKPFSLARKFDLVICLEVAEHIPEDACDDLLNNLANHSDLILFSAAIPGQGGFEHINEKWQSHWVKKFADLGYQAFDFIRPSIWGNADVKFYYQQNAMLCANKAVISRYPELLKPANVCWDIVHPELYNRLRDPTNISLKRVITNLPKILRNYLR